MLAGNNLYANLRIKKINNKIMIWGIFMNRSNIGAQVVVGLR